MSRPRPTKSLKNVTSASKSVLLVDGNSVLKTACHGASDLMYDGINIGGIYQFVMIIRKIISNHNYDECIIFWDDKSNGYLRNDIYKDYKENRKTQDDFQTVLEKSIPFQREYVKNLTELFGIKNYSTPRVEADDCIAYYCLNTLNDVTVVTRDMDLCQLISKNVRVYLLHKKKYFNEYSFKDEYGYSPNNILTFKTICGDSSDSIEGITLLKEKGLINLFPEITDRHVKYTEVVEYGKKLLLERKKNKQKPLKKIENLVKGINKKNIKRIFELNEKLVDLSEPIISDKGKKDIELIVLCEYDTKKIDEKLILDSIKNVGIDNLFFGYDGYYNFLKPFIDLKNRFNKIKKQ